MAEQPTDLFIVFQMFVFELLKIIVPAAASYALWLFVVGFRALVNSIKLRLNAQQRATLDSIIAVAVSAAENVKLDEAIVNKGREKLAYALSYTKSELEKLGWSKFDDEQLKTLIESALNNQWHTIIVPPPSTTIV